MPDRLGWRRQPCLCLDGSIVVLLMSELCKTLEYEFLDPPNASVVQQAQCRTGLPLSSSSFFPGSIVCTHLWSISSKANLITAQQVDYVVVQLPVCYVSRNSHREDTCSCEKMRFETEQREVFRGKISNASNVHIVQMTEISGWLR